MWTRCSHTEQRSDEVVKNDSEKSVGVIAPHSHENLLVQQPAHRLLFQLRFYSKLSPYITQQQVIHLFEILPSIHILRTHVHRSIHQQILIRTFELQHSNICLQRLQTLHNLFRNWNLNLWWSSNQRFQHRTTPSETAYRRIIRMSTDIMLWNTDNIFRILTWTNRLKWFNFHAKITFWTLPHFIWKFQETSLRFLQNDTSAHWTLTADKSKKYTINCYWYLKTQFHQTHRSQQIWFGGHLLQGLQHRVSLSSRRILETDKIYTYQILVNFRPCIDQRSHPNVPTQSSIQSRSCQSSPSLHIRSLSLSLVASSLRLYDASVCFEAASRNQRTLLNQSSCCALIDLSTELMKPCLEAIDQISYDTLALSERLREINSSLQSSSVRLSELLASELLASRSLHTISTCGSMSCVWITSPSIRESNFGLGLSSRAPQNSVKRARSTWTICPTYIHRDAVNLTFITMYSSLTRRTKFQVLFAWKHGSRQHHCIDRPLLLSRRNLKTCCPRLTFSSVRPSLLLTLT